MENKKTGTSFLFALFNETSQEEKNRIERKAIDLIREYKLALSGCFWENYEGTIALTIKTEQQIDTLDKMWFFFIRDFLEKINQTEKSWGKRIISLWKIF